MTLDLNCLFLPVRGKLLCLVHYGTLSNWKNVKISGICREGRLVAGGGALEMELAKEVTSFGEKCEGLEQYAVQRFAQSLHVVPKMLAENTGIKANVVIAELAAAHAEGKPYAGGIFFRIFIQQW